MGAEHLLASLDERYDALRTGRPERDHEATRSGGARSGALEDPAAGRTGPERKGVPHGE
jgi:hypothetical protein